MVAIWDARNARIPNWLTFPIMLVAGGYRLYEGRWHFAWAWVVIFLLWQLNVLGGGDAKLLMGLVALFPEPLFLLVFAMVGLTVRVPLIVRKYWGRRPLDLMASVINRLRGGRFVPSRAELQKHGHSYAWTYCLPGVIYLWFFGGAG